jgi:ArsR family transcriptional regulator
MKDTDALAALAALSQENRLAVFRLLVQAGPDGLAAGHVAETLDIAPNALTFHFDRLRSAGLVTVRREGRSMIYAAQFAAMNALLAFLTETAAKAPRKNARPPSASRRRPSQPVQRSSLERMRP